MNKELIFILECIKKDGKQCFKLVEYMECGYISYINCPLLHEHAGYYYSDEIINLGRRIL